MPRPLVQRAIDARGGSIGALVRRSDATVHVGYPGRWRWRTIFSSPDRYAWSIQTTAEPTHYLYDGAAVRSFIGDAEVAAEPAATAPLRSHARLTGALLLDGLLAPGLHVRELGASERPSGTVAALVVVFPDDGTRLVVALDEELLVASVEGPLDLSPYGMGAVRLDVTDYRRVDRRLIAHRLAWTMDGRALAEERVVAACVVRGRLGPERFGHPAVLPDCR
jgi:hypothetical protein